MACSRRKAALAAAIPGGSEEIMIDLAMRMAVMATAATGSDSRLEALEDSVEEVASEYNLILLEVSDAHNVENIGLRYTEVEMDDLYARSVPEA